jgi:hypothetical protein
MSICRIDPKWDRRFAARANKRSDNAKVLIGTNKIARTMAGKYSKKTNNKH